VTVGFWILTIVMAVLAFSFVAVPLGRAQKRIGIVIALATLAIGAAALYWVVGSPDAPVAASATTARMSTSPEAGTKTAVGSVASMVDGLAERLRQDPDNGKDWILLARSYEYLDRIPEARDAYARAVALGEYDERLAALGDTSSANDAGSAQIVGKLRLAPESQAIVEATDTVFIFAKAVDGPPMPIAVLQRPVADLPLEFELNDSQAMSPEIRLSNFDRVVVTARISRSGVATDALQGLEATSGEINIADNSHLDLTIQ
jgi:hypothetical protein